MPVVSALAFILVGLVPGSIRQSAMLLAAAPSSDATTRIAPTRDLSLAATPSLATLGELPLHFECATDDSRFTARGRGYDVTVDATGAVVSLRDAGESAAVRLTPIGAGRPSALVGVN